MNRVIQSIGALILILALAACQWLVPGSTPGGLPTGLPQPTAEAPRLSPSIEIPPPYD